jgi:hypothetical protein
MSLTDFRSPKMLRAKGFPRRCLLLFHPILQPLPAALQVLWQTTMSRYVGNVSNEIACFNQVGQNAKNPQDWIRLVSTDGYTYLIQRKVAMVSGTLRNMLSNDFAESASNTCPVNERYISSLLVHALKVTRRKPEALSWRSCVNTCSTNLRTRTRRQRMTYPTLRRGYRRKLP